MNILEDLWYGNICPVNDMGVFEWKRSKLMNLCDRNHEALMATLSDEQKSNLEKLYDLWIENQMQGQRDAFAIGFRLGVQLMTAAVCRLSEPEI